MQTIQHMVKHQASEGLNFSCFMSQYLVPTRNNPAKDQTGLSQSLQVGWGWVKTQSKLQGALSPHAHGGLPANCQQLGSAMVLLVAPSFSCPIGNIRALRVVEDPNNSSSLNRCVSSSNIIES